MERKSTDLTTEGLYCTWNDSLLEMTRAQAGRESLGNEERRCGRVVKAPDLKSAGRGFKSHSDDQPVLPAVFPSLTAQSRLSTADSYASCQLGFLKLLCLFALFVCNCPKKFLGRLLN